MKRGVSGTIYVFDTSVWHQFGNYYRPTFDPIWDLLEVYDEIQNGNGKKDLLDWVDANGEVFISPTEEDFGCVKKIFGYPHFQQLVARKERLTSGPAADPFVIAAAMVRGSCVVSQESAPKNGAKIPNVCAHFGVGCIKLDEFLSIEGWQFRR